MRSCPPFPLANGRAERWRPVRRHGAAGLPPLQPAAANESPGQWRLVWPPTSGQEVSKIVVRPWAAWILQVLGSMPGTVSISTIQKFFWLFLHKTRIWKVLHVLNIYFVYASNFSISYLFLPPRFLRIQYIIIVISFKS
jgi:hypothetical protein